jgi:hypothetical protein
MAIVRPRILSMPPIIPAKAQIVKRLTDLRFLPFSVNIKARLSGAQSGASGG